ncbi:WD40 repeat-like protein [Rhizodiscina lignyota]|uniref:WD40 repeat-like protein n=1 Tax=Rhizodiscina lignyota TaxID=1504668 RepID=A0A9P4IQI8_9PEZI|nr:WD40 repeat-like protein [Rhizodiscina lignyota]
MSNSTNGGRVPTGWADEIVISDSTFRAAHNKLQSAAEPPTKKRKREEAGDPSKIYGAGAYKGPWAKYKEDTPEESSDEDEEVVVVYEEDEIEEQPARPATTAGTDYEGDNGSKETSEFHGEEMYDYQGRTYMHVPQDLGIDLRGDISSLQCYHPKRQIHTFKGHTGPINQMRFFPSSGHLLLSASADCKVKLWDVYHERSLLRTYSGHSKSVNDIAFNNDGTRFLTASYDRQMKLWDTETGACISRFSTGKTAHVVRFNPDPAHNHEFLAGMADKKIVQFDTKSGEQVQEYDHHLGPVNTVTFCDENRRFITTSDDKSLRAWEYGIPVPIKFIAEPHMFSMVRAASHPKKPFVAFQSQDNQIVVYASSERFRQNRKKGFKGHNNAGYAIDVDISPDGGIVMSGDSGGYVCFWDWKTCKMWHKIKASETPVVACQWHPRETSKVVTGDLAGLIKYWD